MKAYSIAAIAVCSVIPTLAALAAPPVAGEPVVFEKHIRPILKAHCFQCHGEEDVKKGGLDVRLRRFIAVGGKSGPAIVPGAPAESHLLQLLQKGEMPKGKGKLPEHELALIERWIAAGAPTARPEPEKLGPEFVFTDEERAWWAFQPIQRPSLPPQAKPGATALDAFIGKRLVEAKLGFSAEADAVTLIRRVTFDLTGLPPTPEEVDEFLAATRVNAEQAYGDLVDRLLASPAYGERWARHWLDVAGYADSDGYTEKDPERPHAYRYRDYVIQAFNSDKPFDEFVREQLAGDEIAAQAGLNANSPTETERMRFAELLSATGFLRMAPDGTAVKNDVTARNDSVADTLKIVSTSLYGLTIGCAQCHDHRYDPISQADYYRLRAVFEPGFDLVSWRQPAQRLQSLQTKEEAATAATIEAEAKKIDDVRLVKQEEFITAVLEKELEKREEGIRDALRTAYRTVAKDRTPEQIALLKANPSVMSLSAGSLYLYDTTYRTKHAADLKVLADEAAAVRATKPVVRYIHAFTELPKRPEVVPATHIFHRGDPESPKEAVKPADLSVLAGWRNIAIPEHTRTMPSTGRRLALSQALTDGSHPLLARVIVNRVWMHHFGKGLVATPGDFGHLGELPSHPELLDWMASEFMQTGWSVKRLHRLILHSRAYRQDSGRDPVRERIDPDNRLLSRQNVRRLEAENLRDALLAVGGTLNPKFFGEPVPVMFTVEGQVVLGVDTTDTAGRQTGQFVSLKGEEFRRSIYVQARRTRPLDMFAAFDAPAMTDANCQIRPVTTVSPQSLLLMNNSTMREFAQAFAVRLQAEAPGNLREQVRRAWRLAYSREPNEEDYLASVEFVAAQSLHYEANPAKLEKTSGPAETKNAKPLLLGLTALCHALVSSNEFLYID